MQLELSKEELNILGKFVGSTAPVLHSRNPSGWGKACSQNCEACEYLEKQRKAVDVVCKLRLQEEEYDVRGFVE